MIGKVAWFDSAKGFGFISRDDGHGDVFVHYSNIAATGYKQLNEGQKVSFEIEEGPKGKPQAVSVTAVA